jgi:DNA-binding NarL/FixJ family response regulator
MITLLIVEPRQSLSRGLHLRLAAERDVEVVGEATSCNVAISLAQAVHPDVVLLDVDTLGEEGFIGAWALHLHIPDSALVVLSLYDDVDAQFRAQAAGGVAFVTKCGAMAELPAAIRRAASDRTSH